MLRRITYISATISLLAGCSALEVDTDGPDVEDVIEPRDSTPRADSGEPDSTIEDTAGDAPTDGTDGTDDAGGTDTNDDPRADGGDDAREDGGDDARADGGDDTAADVAEDVEPDADTIIEDTEPDVPLFGGPPLIDRLYPEIVLSDGLFYVEGAFLARPPNDVSDTDVTIVTDDAELGEIRIDVRVITGTTSRLVVAAPRDLHERLLGRGTVVVTTPEGVAEYRSVYATNDSTFSGKTEPGAGLVGNVYRLHSGTSLLPNLDDPCSDPTVLDTDEHPCPFTSILLENVNIPMRSWDTGFPGLLADVDEWFAIRFQGFLDIAEAGSYAFQTCSDDGSRLWVYGEGGRVAVVENDSTHPMQCRDGRIDLPAGRIPIHLDYFQGPRTEIGLVLSWQPPGTSEWTVVPPEVVHLFELGEL